jgi:peptide/nickel transport system permease protein
MTTAKLLLPTTTELTKYLVRRVLISIPVLAGISLVLFTILALAPGDPFEELATNPNVPPEVRMNLRAQFGLDDPVAVRYLRWFTSMMKGDWGFSFVSRVNVDQLILQRLPTTILVIGSAQLLGLLIAIPIGVISATRPYSLFDQVATTGAFLGFSLPTFFTGLLFILFFSIYLDWLPFIYRADISASGWRWWWEHIRQAIMPVSVLALFQAASMTRFMRSAVLDVIQLDYVRTARAKGLAERVTIVRHVVRNALIPVVTLVALQVPTIFAGALITEQIFRVPGIGSLLISSILANDTPVIMAITFVFSALVVLFNLIADILYGWLDPRISYR